MYTSSPKQSCGIFEKTSANKSHDGPLLSKGFLLWAIRLVYGILSSFALS